MTENEAERMARARSFGAAAAAYDEHRPDYPAEALRWGLAGVTGTATHVLDLGAGTGKLTRNLVELGLRVTAAEPDHAMLDRLRRELPQVTALESSAEDIPLDDGAAEAVFAGQALHWFDLGPAMAEIARVLRPGGVLVALWNYDDESRDWVAALSALTPLGSTNSWLADNGFPEHEAFEPGESETFAHSQRRTIESLLASLATQSRLLVASDEERAAVLRDARDVLTAHPETASGEFDRPLLTTAFRAIRS